MKTNQVKLIVLDVDGVLTDGKIMIDSRGVEIKAFSVKDGMGICLAKFYGIKFAIISGRFSEAVDIRAKELQIDFLYQGVMDKNAKLEELLERLKIDYRNVCIIGDDLNDLPIILKSGLSFAPQDAAEQIKERVTHITSAKGGNGAVREMIEFILKSETDFDNLIENFLYDRMS
ncbi:KdsC family phosphatase [Heyndrickxia oleronia]|uniref:KdsC family phosphatase n=1 Tax=Heyndrickxia oleronia TaxID=38875 RepID=UPI001C0F2C7A|nr:HAD hydrolase family protein [Heyndrickxia oleronia]MBU5210412.1 HAD hydrolase family protein [Heyndrickxia oleronia]